ncbi:MAG TPA: alpha/beta fold hydrolase [Anaerolineales bacterium]|jgi:pimeloyl-ACP methyl ester carboxylesterase|nr:alpha/beta fold hydrolase [Anaerolineales bacterium]
MKKLHSALLPLILLLSACAVPELAPTTTSVPSQEPSPTHVAVAVTPLESAFAPENPTAAPTDDILAFHSVSFETPDGATIAGELYGSGETAIIFSVMGNCKPGWQDLAQLTAAQGRMALTYPWRGCRESGFSEQDELQKFVDDARGAIDFVRGQGAEKIILAGASLGGLASAKLAMESGASGLIVVASPPSIPEWDFEIEAADLTTDIPKLFITAENDPTVPATATRELYELAAEPKEWQTYPENKHGTDIFETESGEAMQARILEFILRIAAE